MNVTRLAKQGCKFQWLSRRRCDQFARTAARRRKTQRLRLAISDAAAPGHVVLAPATIVVLQTAPRRHLRLQALETASRPLPRLVSLLPLFLRQPDSHSEAAAPATADGARASQHSVGTAEQLVSSAMGSAPGAAAVVVGADGVLRLPGFDGGGSAGRWLGAPGTAQLLQLFPAWLAAQAGALGGALDDAVLLQVPKRSGRTDAFAVCARKRNRPTHIGQHLHMSLATQQCALTNKSPTS